MNNLEAVNFVKEHLSDSEKVNLNALEQQINTLGANARDYVERFNNEMKQLKSSTSVTAGGKNDQYAAKRAEAKNMVEEFGRQQFNLKNDITKLLKDSATRQAGAGELFRAQENVAALGGVWKDFIANAEPMKKAVALLPEQATNYNQTVYYDTLPFLARDINKALSPLDNTSYNPFY